jgi:hypothetical protein
MTIRIIACASLLAFLAAPAAGVAETRSYDGLWRLSIVTEHGGCDGYDLPVQITNGNVSIPGLDNASGRVAADGAVFVTVAASGKSASGSGKLYHAAGSGRWTGRSGKNHCSGSWIAQKF